MDPWGVATLRLNCGRLAGSPYIFENSRHSIPPLTMMQGGGVIAEVIEDHIREHMVDPEAPRDDPRIMAAEELVEIVRQYLKK